MRVVEASALRLDGRAMGRASTVGARGGTGSGCESALNAAELFACPFVAEAPESARLKGDVWTVPCFFVFTTVVVVTDDNG